MRTFPNPEACLRLVIALCVEQCEAWLAGRVNLDMAKLDAADDSPAAEGEEVSSVAA